MTEEQVWDSSLFNFVSWNVDKNPMAPGCTQPQLGTVHMTLKLLDRPE